MCVVGRPLRVGGQQQAWACTADACGCTAARLARPTAAQARRASTRALPLPAGNSTPAAAAPSSAPACWKAAQLANQRQPNEKRSGAAMGAHPGSDLRHLRSRRQVGWILPLQSHVTIACSNVTVGKQTCCGFGYAAGAMCPPGSCRSSLTSRLPARMSTWQQRVSFAACSRAAGGALSPPQSHVTMACSGCGSKQEVWRQVAVGELGKPLPRPFFQQLPVTGSWPPALAPSKQLERQQRQRRAAHNNTCTRACMRRRQAAPEHAGTTEYSTNGGATPPAARLHKILHPCIAAVRLRHARLRRLPIAACAGLLCCHEGCVDRQTK